MPDMNKNELLDPLVRDLLNEKRSDRRWRNIRFFFGFFLVAYIVYGIFSLSGGPAMPEGGQGKYVSFIRLDGMIAPDRAFSAEELIPELRDAFKDKNAAGVVIDINSPGGTPAQASIIHDAILTLKKKYNKKVVVVGEDFLTSGAYFVAVAADKIYVNPNTITGSIGVIMKGFGFVDIMKKAGIERRVYTAGNEKDRLDPFLPQNPEDIEKIKQVMTDVHQNFMIAVLQGRKGKLKASPATLFNGDFWSGTTAVNLGLADATGNLIDVMQKEFDTTKYREYGGMPDVLKYLGGSLNSSIDSFLYRMM